MEIEKDKDRRLKISSEWKRTLLRLLWLLLIPFAFLMAELASQYPYVVETVYTNGIYPVISTAVGKVFGLLPFSFAEFLIYALLGLLALWIVVTIYKAIKRSLKAIRLVRTLISYAIVVAVAINAFYFMWGFNYYRLSVAYSLGIELKERDTQELADLCVSLAYAANTLREEVPEDERGVFAYDKDTNEVLQEIPSAYNNLGEIHPQFEHEIEIPAPKPVVASEAMSWAGISGIFIPFTEEANVNVHQDDLLLASSAAHESAHFMGVAREDEANFVSFLACLSSDDPSIQYSGVMLGLIHAGNALADVSPEAYSQLRALYSDGVKLDLSAHSAYWKQYEGKAEEVVTQMNDNYLKQHKQEDGVQSYGRMVDLMLAYYDDV